MTDDDALRARLAATDPAATATVRPIPRSLLEQTMSSTLDNDTTAESTTSRRTPFLAAAAAAAAVAIAGGTYLAMEDGGGAQDRPAIRTALQLQAPPSNIMGMCLQITPEIVRDVQLAFAGEVTAIEGTKVTVAVSRWFKGGTADDVVLTTSTESVALDGVAFTDGEQVLVAANDGLVAGCGLSGEQSPALQDIYEQAFPG